MLYTLVPPHNIPHCCFLDHPIKLFHSSDRFHLRLRHSNKRIPPSHFTTGILYSLSAIDKQQDNKDNHLICDDEDGDSAFLNLVYESSPICLKDTREKNEFKESSVRDRVESNSSIFANMWWADIKAAVGQRINLQGLLFSVSVITRNKHWVIPDVSVPDIRYVDWVVLKRKWFELCLIRTILLPFLTLWPYGRRLRRPWSHAN